MIIACRFDVGNQAYTTYYWVYKITQIPSGDLNAIVYILIYICIKLKGFHEHNRQNLKIL